VLFEIFETTVVEWIEIGLFGLFEPTILLPQPHF
jgi:hypothetical protein